MSQTQERLLFIGLAIACLALGYGLHTPCPKPVEIVRVLPVGIFCADTERKLERCLAESWEADDCKTPGRKEVE